MRTLLFFATSIALISLNACSKGGCTEHAKLPCDVIDINPNYYDPVCDCQGNTYQNEAVIQCLEGKTKYKKGKCK
mgnify:CR=1 FL=1|jgi:hypothetical protein